MELLYWHWIVLGIGLVLLELLIPSFTALWFGLGAISVGFMLLFDPTLSLTFQVSFWASVSAILTLSWFKYFKPEPKHGGNVSLADVEGEVGLVISKPSGGRSGKVRFSTPLQGVDEWHFKSDEDLEAGDQIEVIGIKDSVLKMKKR